MGIADLTGIFQSVQKALLNNQEEINQADELHHDHGNNMVEIFNVITNAVQAKKDANPSTQLDYAGELLQKSVKSSTAQVYAEGLKNASKQFSSKEISPNTAVDFVQTLLGGQVQPESSGDLLGGLLSSLTGAEPQQQAKPQSEPDGGLLGGLLSTLTGAEPQTNADSQFGLDDILEIGMGYLQAKQAGKGDLEALAGAVLQKTLMGQKQHRAASGKVVAKSLLDAITSFSK